MGVNTKAIIRGFVSAMDIALLIRDKGWAEVDSVKFTFNENMYKLVVRPNWTEEEMNIPLHLRTKREKMTFHVFENGDCACDYDFVTKGNATLILASSRNFNTELLTKIAENYGGWVQNEAIKPDVYTDVHTLETVTR